MRMWGRIALLALAAGWAQGGLACGTDVTVSFAPTTPTVASWSPFPSGTQQTVTFNVTVNKTGGGGNVRKARLIIRDTESDATLRFATLSGFPGPIYTVEPGGRNSTATNAGLTDSNSLFFDYGSGNGSVTKTATLTVPVNSANADFISGTYSQTTTYLVQCYNNGGSAQGIAQTGTGPTLNVVVPALVSTITASPTSINFGNFTQLNQPVSLTVSSTGTINATISTTNGNQMVLTGAQLPYPTNSTIPYNLTFESQSVPAAGATRPNLTRTGVGGGSKSLLLALPAIPTGKLAGTYTDTITITMTPGT
jgi:spore coat protein U-like protein